MKTLPTPHLSTGIVYYKKQLWIFCFGIDDAAERNAYMKVWDETLALRGSCEVASGLLYYLKMKNLDKEVIPWSNACGGKKCNIYMTLFWLHIVTSENFNVNIIKHKLSVVTVMIVIKTFDLETYKICSRSTELVTINSISLPRVLSKTTG